MVNLKIHLLHIPLLLSLQYRYRCVPDNSRKTLYFLLFCCTARDAPSTHSNSIHRVRIVPRRPAVRSTDRHWQVPRHGVPMAGAEERHGTRDEVCHDVGEHDYAGADDQRCDRNSWVSVLRRRQILLRHRLARRRHDRLHVQRGRCVFFKGPTDASNRSRHCCQTMHHAWTLCAWSLGMASW